MSDHASNNKRIAVNTVFLYFRSIFLLLITLYTSRVTLQVLGVEDYGIYQLVGGVVAMFSMLSSTLSSASQRFITYALGENNHDKLRRVFSTCITLHIVLGAIVVVLLEVLGIWFLNNKLNIPLERLSTATWVMQFSIATFFVSVISVPFNAVIIAHERMSAFAYISILEGLLKLGTVFVLMYIGWDKLLFYAVINFGIAVLLRAIYSVYSHRHFEETRNAKFRIDRLLFKDMFAFAGWNLFGNGSLVLRNQGVDIVLNLFFGVVVNAAKGVSNQVQTAIQQLVGNFTTAMKPQMTKAVAQDDYERAYSLINNGSRFTFLLMLIFAVPVMVNAQALLSLWLGTVPDYSVQFVQWTMCYILLDSLSRMMIHAILSKGDIKKYQIIVGGTKLFAIPMTYCWLLFTPYPLIGIWVNIILEVICLAQRLYFNHKQLNFEYRHFILDVILRCAILFAISLLFSWLFYNYVSANFLLSVIASGTITVSAIWFVGMKANEHKMVLNFISTKLHRLS